MPPKKRKASLTGRRENDKRKKEEQAQNTSRRQQAREDPEVRQQEQAQNTSRRQQAREDPIVREEEQAQNTYRRRAAREDPEVREEEQVQDTNRRRAVRENSEVRQQEQAQDSSRRREAREDPEVREEEQERSSQRRRVKKNEQISFETALAKLKVELQNGPSHICVSCDMLFFRDQIVERTRQKLIEKGKTESYLDSLILLHHQQDSNYIFCRTCISSVNKKGDLFPKLNINNSKLQFPTVPDVVKNLKPLEQRCVAPRIPFMKLQALGCDRQWGLKSGIVNVPVNVRSTLEKIPARPGVSGVVEIEFMRSMKYKNFVWKERVRTEDCYKAAEYLVTTPLYIQEGIKLNTEFDGKFSIICFFSCN